MLYDEVMVVYNKNHTRLD